MNLLREKLNLVFAQRGERPEDISVLHNKGIITIYEKDNRGTDKFEELILTTEHEVLEIRNSFIKSLKNLFGPKILQKDCDAVILFNYNDTKYLYLIEMKSSFGKDTIREAKNQILSTYVKMNVLLPMIDGFKKDDYRFHGIIVSWEPDVESRKTFADTLELPDENAQKQRSLFALNLLLKNECNVSLKDCPELTGLSLAPQCLFQDFPFHYWGVTDNRKEYKKDLFPL